MADFKAQYEFKADNKEVVIQHKGGAYLRVDPNKNDQADPSGGTGKWARFIVEKQGGNKIKLKAKETGKYLRIVNGNIDIGGGGGKFTVFKAHQQGTPGAVKLESVENAGKYIAVGKMNKIRIGPGGPRTELQFFRETVKPFTKPYMFKAKNIVVIQHRGGAGADKGPTKFLRVKPGNLEHADPDGGRGDFAQFEAEPAGNTCRFKSTKSNKYLRIFNGNIDVGGGGGKFTVFVVHRQGDGSVKLQSQVFPKQYIAVGPGNKVRPGNAGPFTKVMVYRKN